MSDPITDEIERMRASVSGHYGIIDSAWEGAWWVASRPWWSPIVTLTRYVGTRDNHKLSGETLRIGLLTFWRFKREVERARRLPRARIHNPAPRAVGRE